MGEGCFAPRGEGEIDAIPLGPQDLQSDSDIPFGEFKSGWKELYYTSFM